MNIPDITALIFMKYHSERVPKKNIKEFNGLPLFHWILKALESSKYITEIIINTDSKEIAEEAKKHFDVTIHMRPEHLLTITSNEANQIIEYDLSKSEGEYFLQTHSTNPILRAETIDNAVKAFFETDEHDSLMSVTPLRKRLYWPDGKPINHDPHAMIKTQNLEPVYEENSCIYMFSKKGFLKDNDRIGENPFFFEIDPVEAMDIDEESDFIIAESIKKYLEQKKN